MQPSQVIDLKTFVPTRDPELSKKFYTDLGFTINWSNDEIAELEVGSFRFLLQKFYVKEHAGNFMMSLQVEDADAWWEHIQRVRNRKEVPRNHVQSPCDAALGNTRALSERPNRCSVEHHRYEEGVELPDKPIQLRTGFRYSATEHDPSLLFP